LFTTPTIPAAPSPMKSAIEASSPHRTSASVSARRRRTRSVDASASLTATTCGKRPATSATTSGIMSTPVREGTLYRTIGRVTASATAEKCSTRPRGVGLL
jgi:hypothetical protein